MNDLNDLNPELDNDDALLPDGEPEVDGEAVDAADEADALSFADDEDAIAEDYPDPDEEEALEEVDELGGDPDIMKSLPDEGQPIDDDFEADDDDDIEGPALLTYRVEGVPDEPEYTDEDYDDEALTAPYDPYADLLDIDAALASVSSLSEMIVEREPAEPDERVRTQVLEERPPVRARRMLAEPPSITLRRGQPASVVPALIFIGVGAWLTFAMSAPGSVSASPALVTAVLGGALIVTLLAQFVTSGRWSRGVFFFAVLALLVGGALYYQSMSPATAALTAPLILLAVGVAFALTGFMARPTDRRLLLPGAAFVMLAALALVIALGVLPVPLTSQMTPFWPIVVAVLALIWLLPVVFKRRG
jgi:hypothetical protein